MSTYYFISKFNKHKFFIVESTLPKLVLKYFIDIWNKVRWTWFHVVFFQSKPNCLFPLLMDRLALPRAYLVPNKQIPAHISEAIRHFIHMVSLISLYETCFESWFSRLQRESSILTDWNHEPLITYWHWLVSVCSGSWSSWLSTGSIHKKEVAGDHKPLPQSLPHGEWVKHYRDWTEPDNKSYGNSNTWWNNRLAFTKHCHITWQWLMNNDISFLYRTKSNINKALGDFAQVKKLQSVPLEEQYIVSFLPQ